MTTTTYFGFNIPDGTDNVNLLTQNYPNWSNLDAILKAIKDTGITAATATKTGTNFAVVRSDADCKFFGFVALSNYDAGDSFTVDGVPVTATTPAGTSLPQGAFVINQTVLACLNGAVLTVYVSAGATTIDAEDVNYDNSGSGLTAADVQAAIDELENEIAALPPIPSTYNADDIVYDNTNSGLTATDVQAALDEIVAGLLNPYTSTGLSTFGATIDAGGFRLVGDYVEIDITITTTTTIANLDKVVSGFPNSLLASGQYPTPDNNGLRAYQYTNRVDLVNSSGSAMASGVTKRFIGTYKFR